MTTYWKTNEIATIRELSATKTQREVAEIMGVTLGALKRVCNRYRISFRRKGKLAAIREARAA